MLEFDGVGMVIGFLKSGAVGPPRNSTLVPDLHRSANRLHSGVFQSRFVADVLPGGRSNRGCRTAGVPAGKSVANRMDSQI